MSKTFKFCHVSDLHLAIKANQQSIKDVMKMYKCKMNNNTSSIGKFTTYERVKLEALARFVFNNKDKFDFILITGDISSSASSEDLKTAHNFLKTEKESNNWLIEPDVYFDNGFFIGHKSIVLLPGNHDRIDYSTLSFKYSNNFDNIFKDFWAPNTPSNRIESEEVYIPEVDLTMTILKIDFSLDENRFSSHNIGTGYVEDYIMNDLKIILEHFKKENRSYIIALHYPPKSENTNFSLRLREEDRLISILKEYNVPYIFTGHSHIEDHDKIPSTEILNYCSDATTSFCEESNINIFTLDVLNNQIVDKEQFAWSAKDREFI